MFAFSRPIQLSIIIVLLLCLSCNSSPEPKDSLNDLFASQNVKQNRELVLVLLSPDECMSCVPTLNQNFNDILAGNYGPSENVFVVMPYMRDVERKAYFTNRINLVVDKEVIYSDAVYGAVRKLTRDPYPISKLVVFDSYQEYSRFGHFKSLKTVNQIRGFLYQEEAGI